MKLYAISDLHLNFKTNREALKDLRDYPDDWLILAGDFADTENIFIQDLSILRKKFNKIFWVPGNHDLWTLPMDSCQLKGKARYLHLVNICRDFGVLTPEDPFLEWPGNDEKYIIAPIFILYDYSFRPKHVSLDESIGWAGETGVLSTDEFFLYTDPYSDKIEWCKMRYNYTIKRLNEVKNKGKLILINHFPLKERLVNLKRIPRFSIWCGTKLTEDLLTRFPVSIVIYGHLHIRGTYHQDGISFEEVSLGYPKNWDQDFVIDTYLREIL